MNLGKKDAAEILAHLQEIRAILEPYDQETEQFDQVDRIAGKVKDIELIIELEG